MKIIVTKVRCFRDNYQMKIKVEIFRDHYHNSVNHLCLIIYMILIMKNNKLVVMVVKILNKKLHNLNLHELIKDYQMKKDKNIKVVLKENYKTT